MDKRSGGLIKVLGPVLRLLGATLAMLGLSVSAMEIEGSQKYTRQVEQCLALLRTKAADDYAFVLGNIGVIAQNERSGMLAWANPPRYQMSDVTAFYSLTWCAGTIAHDAYHAYLYRQYQAEHSQRPPYEVWGGVAAEKLAIDFQLQVMQKIGASAHELNYLKSLDGTHGDVNKDGKLDGQDYQQRTW
jgi:hypothetical protein